MMSLEKILAYVGEDYDAVQLTDEDLNLIDSLALPFGSSASVNENRSSNAPRIPGDAASNASSNRFDFSLPADGEAS